MLNVFASVVADHHFISDHERLHEALAADGASLSVGAVRLLAVILRDRGRVDRRRRRCAKLARCTAFNEVCEWQADEDRLANYEMTVYDQIMIISLRESWFVYARWT